MRNIIRTSALAIAVLALPLVASAQTVQAIFGIFGTIINLTVFLVIGIALIVFFFGLVRYLAGGTEMKAKGLQIMLYGIIALFVMVSIWGLVRLLQTTFLGGANTNAPSVGQLLPSS